MSFICVRLSYIIQFTFYFFLSIHLQKSSKPPSHVVHINRYSHLTWILCILTQWYFEKMTLKFQGDTPLRTLHIWKYQCITRYCHECSWCIGCNFFGRLYKHIYYTSNNIYFYCKYYNGDDSWVIMISFVCFHLLFQYTSVTMDSAAGYYICCTGCPISYIPSCMFVCLLP